MKRLREKVRDRTGRNRAGTDIRVIIAELTPILRGWEITFAPATPPTSSPRSTGTCGGGCSA
ncbi:group II intron, maturase-specific domain protein [Mycobacterium xenopi 4042]|uniref:Group II intron, maturase-specific domain protein n=1 Tax=Mycobacterium xenopi 4042 TaxID=1299334 RepID=X8DC10_MYCXE|nr:group II intron, maturase-specific domain protein [Mycobacterium xenopi 4042]